MDNEDESPITIPYDGASGLSAEALAGVIDAYILREGTDYGLVETDMDSKRAQVRRQLEAGTAVIRYYPAADHVTIEAQDR
ncbi:MAG: YheU family protein [Pseudomonadota bacterium]